MPSEGDQEYQGRRSQVGVGRKPELRLSCVGVPIRCREVAGATAVLARRSGGAGGAEVQVGGLEEHCLLGDMLPSEK